MPLGFHFAGQATLWNVRDTARQLSQLYSDIAECIASAEATIAQSRQLVADADAVLARITIRGRALADIRTQAAKRS